MTSAAKQGLVFEITSSSPIPRLVCCIFLRVGRDNTLDLL